MKAIEIYVKLQSQLRSMLKDEEGATMVEYALMVALIAAVCVATVQIIGTGANTEFTKITDYLK